MWNSKESSGRLEESDQPMETGGQTNHCNITRQSHSRAEPASRPASRIVDAVRAALRPCSHEPCSERAKPDGLLRVLLDRLSELGDVGVLERAQDLPVMTCVIDDPHIRNS